MADRMEKSMVALKGQFVLPVLTFANLTALEVFHGVTTRAWRSLNPFQGYEWPQRLNNGVRLQCGFPAAMQVVYAEEVLGANVHRCSSGDAASIRLQCDALISDIDNLLLAVYMADCFPILIANIRTGEVAAIHASRKGTIAGIVEHTVSALLKHNHRPSDLIAGIGPGLRSCCYAIQEDIMPELERASWLSFVQQREGILYLDLSYACHSVLERLGIPATNIEDMDICTCCRSDLLFSARKRGASDERGASFAALISSGRKRTASDGICPI